MLFKNEAAEKEWAEIEANWSKGFYEGGILRFAKRYVEKMEAELAPIPEEQRDYAAIAAVAKKWQYDADTEGITGFMYNCAIRALVETWKYSEGLRRFHNIDTDPVQGAAANEKGHLLNGAILVIQTGIEDEDGTNKPAVFNKED